MKEKIWQNILAVRNQSPLVQNITNFVVMNNSANALLAIGASPIMSHAIEEIPAMLDICQSLVINMGTLDENWVASMLAAVKQANKNNKPWVFDPVGVGATNYRNEVAEKLIQFKPTVIRGNGSEILALAKNNHAKTKGVDSSSSSMDAIAAAYLLNEQYDATVCISGEIDIVLSNNRKAYLTNGNAMMTKVTGLGCSSTAVIGAFTAIIDDSFEAALSAQALFSIAGELAAKNVDGPGSLQMKLIDKLYNISEAEFLKTINLVIE